ncbi:MAG: hypothetical protein JNK56_20690, partial [Myxococcales bacterium]|nr:hypothetical protein [Myxococcales bacterium]
MPVHRRLARVLVGLALALPALAPAAASATPDLPTPDLPTPDLLAAPDLLA